jgi:ubiquinone biosynthesis protein
LIDVVHGLFTGDSEKLLDGFGRMGFVAEGGDRESLRNLTKTYFGKLMKFKDRSPGALLRERKELRKEFNNPDMDMDDLRDLMKSVHFPETWFYIERALVLMFWLSATIEPHLDTVQVGFPYIMPLLMERNRKAADERAAQKAAAKATAAPSQVAGQGSGVGDTGSVPSAS